MVNLSPEPRIQHVIPENYFYVGVDLGQTMDPTAIAVLERIVEGTGQWDITPAKIEIEAEHVRYELRHLQRVALGTTYPNICSLVAAMLCRVELAGQCELILDQTGVGRPVVDIFRESGLELTAVTIVAGDQAKYVGGGDWRVSKLELISTLEARLHDGTLKIAADLDEGEALADELKDFRRHVTAAGNPIFQARIGKHDDLVLALALALWWGENRPTGPTTLKVVGF